MGSLALSFDHRQQQTLSPRLQHAVRLLQLSSLDFAQEVHDALGKNPFLVGDEIDDDGPDDATAFATGEDAPFAASPVERDREIGASDRAEHDGSTRAEFDDLDGERESWFADGGTSRRASTDGETDLADLRHAERTLSDHLLEQIRVSRRSAREQALAAAIVGSLDDDGYLRFPLCELLGIADLTPAEDEDELAAALALVHSLDPAGVGARSVQECLLLQLPTLAGDAMNSARDLARLIITEHFDALAAGDVAVLARTLGHLPARIQAVLDTIRRLDPRPGSRFGPTPWQHITPDVIVKKVRGQWTAALNPAIVPNVRLHKVYAEMFQRHRCAQHSELAAHLQEARWTLSNVEQRFATILSVAQAIVSRQQNFLDYGALAMKPLGLREIADAVGMHESTVSRVTNNKFMATPLGVFELKYFFSRALVTAGGGECSATAIRGLISDMIAAESPLAPLSDPEIARQLARQGLVVARRTVTKYRQLLRIDAAERRRQHA
jgi:RNA polymerase sigma-54 factor